MAPMRKLAATYALSVTAFSRASSPIGGAKGGCAAGFALTCPLRQAAAPPIDPRCNFGAPGGRSPPLGSPYGRAGERSASLRGRRQWQIRKKCRDCCMVPSQSWHQCANLQLPTPSQSRLRRASSPIWGAKGGCAAGFALPYPLRRRISPKTSTGTHLIAGRVPVLCCISSKAVVCL